MKLRLTSKLRSAVMAAFAMAVYASMGTTTLAQNAYAEETGKTLHVYILTGQSNSLGAVKGDPASAETLAYYTTAGKGGDEDGILMWDGNMAGSLTDPTTGGLAWSNDGKQWMTVQTQQTPTGEGNHGAAGTAYENMTGAADLRNAWEGNQGNGVMGPEYGFAYMMQKKGWNVDGGNDVAIIKVSRDGGGNSNWVKPTTEGTSNGYTFLLASVLEAIENIDTDSYDTIQLDGLLYLQGESDKNGEITSAQSRYTDFLTNLKADLAAAGITADIKLTDSVVGEPANWKGTDTVCDNTTTAKELLALSQADNSSTIGDVGYVYTRDLGKINSGDTMGVHYDGNSEITIGARYAYVMAAEQGMDTTDGGTVRVRSQKYGDSQLGESAVSLNDADAWWQSTGDTTAFTFSSLADTVAVWDVSSANMAGTAQGHETLSADLTLGGIRIEDPYADDDTLGTHNATITIANASGVTPTLTVGASGIELQRGNLSLQTAVSTVADQTWKLAAGRTLGISGTMGGKHAIALQNTSGSGMACVALGQADTTHSWSLGSGTSLAGTALGSVSVQDGAAAALAADSVAELSMGSGSSLAIGGEGSVSAMSITSLTLQGAVTFGMDFKSPSTYDSLSIGTMTGTGSAVFDFTVGRTGRSGSYTVVSGWNDAYTFSATGLGEGSSLNLVDGNLVLTLIGGNAPDFSKEWPTETQTQQALAGGTFDASSVSTNGLYSGSTQYFFGIAANRGTAEAPVDIYAEARNVSATWVAGAGYISSSGYKMVYGNVSVLASSDATGSAHTTTAAFGAVNATVHGDVYMELADSNATYSGQLNYAVHGVYNGVVDGTNTLVIRDGVFNSAVSAGATKWTSGQSIGSVQLDIKGGTFKNRVSAAGVGLVTGDVNLLISGGDFSQNANGIYAGGNAAESVVQGNTVTTLADIDSQNSFAAYTGVLSGGAAVDGATIQGKRILRFSGVQADLNAAFRDFDTVEVTDGSETTLKASNFTWVDGASVSVEGESRLTLHKDGYGPWDLTGQSFDIESGSTLAKAAGYWVNVGTLTGSGTYEVTGSGGSQISSLSGFSGTVAVSGGATAEMMNAGSAATTFNVGAGSFAKVAAAAGSVGTLSGSGTVEMKGTVTAGTSGTGFSFAEDWKGKVKLTKDNIDSSGNQELYLSHFGQSGSTIVVDGVGKDRSNYVYLATGDNNAVNADLNLVGDGLTLNAGSSGKFTTFNGAWTGEGAFNFTYGNTTQGFRFYGDMTGYSGDMTFAGKQVVEFGNGGTGVSVGSVSGTGTLNATGAAATLRFNYSGDVNASNLITGNFNLEQNGTASLTLTAANDYTGTTTINSGSIILKENGTLGSGTVTLKASGNATLIAGSVTITALEGGEDVVITGLQPGAISASGINGDFNINRAEVATSAETASTLDTKLQNTALVNSGTGVLTVDNSQNTLTAIHAKNGDVTVQHAKSSENSLKSITAEKGDVALMTGADALSFTLTALSLVDGSAVRAYHGCITLEAASEDAVADLCIEDGGFLTAGEDTHIDANLLIGKNVTITLSGGIDMGCDVALGEDEAFVLTGATVQGGVLKDYVLFTSVDSLTLGGTAIEKEGWYDASEIVGSITANGVLLDTAGADYKIGYWDGTVSLTAANATPEPATGTLGLLALAALCARRRRR